MYGIVGGGGCCWRFLIVSFVLKSFMTPIVYPLFLAMVIIDFILPVLIPLWWVLLSSCVCDIWLLLFINYAFGEIAILTLYSRSIIYLQICCHNTLFKKRTKSWISNKYFKELRNSLMMIWKNRNMSEWF